MRHQAPNTDFQTKRLSLFQPPVFGRQPDDRTSNTGRARVGQTGRRVFDFTSRAGRRAFIDAICVGVHQNSCAMVEHYFFGNGVGRSLRDFRIQNVFRSHRSVRRAVTLFENSMLGRANLQASTACRSNASREGTRRLRINTTSNIPINVNDGRRSPLFALGNGRLQAQANLIATVDCSSGTFQLAGEMRFRYNDRFEDPADIFNQFQGNVEIPGGRPFGLFDSWEQPFAARNQSISMR